MRGASMKYTVIGFVIGLAFSVGVYLAESTTSEISWLLVLSFPVFWPLAGWMYGRWFANEPAREVERMRTYFLRQRSNGFSFFA